MDDITAPVTRYITDIDSNTGEVISNRVIQLGGNQEETALIRFHAKNEQNFIWFECSKDTPLFPELSSTDIMRLFYIATFMDYKGVLNNRKRLEMDKQTVMEYLRLSRRSFTPFFNQMVNMGIFIPGKKSILMNPDYFFKGKISDNALDNIRNLNDKISRIYIKTVREIYEGGNYTDHKKLGALFQLLPYINTKFNIVTADVDEEDLNALHYLSADKLSSVLGVTKHNLNRRLKTLSEYTFGVGKGQEYILRYEDNLRKRKNGVAIYVNPHLYFGGGNPKIPSLIKKYKTTKEKL